MRIPHARPFWKFPTVTFHASASKLHSLMVSGKYMTIFGSSATLYYTTHSILQAYPTSDWKNASVGTTPDHNISLAWPANTFLPHTSPLSSVVQSCRNANGYRCSTTKLLPTARIIMIFIDTWSTIWLSYTPSKYVYAKSNTYPFIFSVEFFPQLYFEPLWNVRSSPSHTH